MLILMCLLGTVLGPLERFYALPNFGVTRRPLHLRRGLLMIHYICYAATLRYES